jgi:hypothetical protein
LAAVPLSTVGMLSVPPTRGTTWQLRRMTVRGRSSVTISIDIRSGMRKPPAEASLACSAAVTSWRSPQALTAKACAASTLPRPTIRARAHWANRMPGSTWSRADG